TYRLTMGLRGSSFAIRMARRLGLADSILERAQKLCEGLGQAEIETILQQLEKTQDRLDQELSKARDSRREARKLEQRLERELDKLRREQRSWIDDEVQSALDELGQAREQVRDLVKTLQSADNHDDIKAAQGALESLEATIGRHKERRQREKVADGRRQAREGELQGGDQVFVLPFKRKGTVLELQSDGKVAIQIGSIRTSANLEDVYVSPNGPQRSEQESTPHRGARPSGSERDGNGVLVLPPQNSNNTVDLRGLRADEALERVELFLDAAYHADEPGIYIIHGHGTGALKRAVRVFLPTSRYVRSYRPGQQGEGGDGVTVAYLS
ncbi:MAG: Smr/MutS family protein, partial [Myxococcota bacterium]